MNSQELIASIHNGLAAGYKQNLLFLSSYENFIGDMREYLLTVNVAQSLLEWNSNHQYKIRLEYPYRTFCLDAFPAVEHKTPDIFTTITSYRNPQELITTKHSQKIDIAIVAEQDANLFSQERPKVGIELKAINKSQKSIRSDARRLAEAMNYNDLISDNSIQFSYCGFLMQLARPSEMATAQLNVQRMELTQRRWDDVCADFALKFPKLQFKVDFQTIIDDPLETVHTENSDPEISYEEVAVRTGALVSGVLEISRVKSTSAVPALSTE